MKIPYLFLLYFFQAIAEALGSDIFDLTVPMAEAVVTSAPPPSIAESPREMLKAAVRNGSSKVCSVKT